MMKKTEDIERADEAANDIGKNEDDCSLNDDLSAESADSGNDDSESKWRQYFHNIKLPKISGLKIEESVRRYRYAPAEWTMIISLFMLVMSLVPVGTRSAIVNADIAIILYSVAGIVSSALFYMSGVFRTVMAIRDPYERYPLTAMIQALLLAVNIVFSIMIVAYGSIPYDPIAQIITLTVVSLCGITVLSFIIGSIYNMMSANTFKRRRLTEKFREELKDTERHISKKHKIMMSVIAALHLAIIVLAVALSIALGTSAVNKDMANAVRPGDSKEHTESIIGKPHYIDGDTWYYYSANYNNLFAKIRSGEAKGKDMSKDREKLAAMEYSRIVITFNDNTGLDRVIYYHKYVDNAEYKPAFLTATAYHSVNIAGKLEYYTSFSDGSTESGWMNDYTAVLVKDNPSRCVVTWQGMYGMYKAEINTKLVDPTKISD